MIAVCKTFTNNLVTLHSFINLNISTSDMRYITYYTILSLYYNKIKVNIRSDNLFSSHTQTQMEKL